MAGSSKSSSRGLDPFHQVRALQEHGVDFGASIFRALSLHIGIDLEIVRREVGEAGLGRRERVLAVEVGFLPVLDMTRQDGFRKERDLAALQSNTPTFEKWASSVLRLGVAVKEFKEEVQIRLDLKIIFA